MRQRDAPSFPVCLRAESGETRQRDNQRDRGTGERDRRELRQRDTRDAQRGERVKPGWSEAGERRERERDNQRDGRASFETRPVIGLFNP